MPEHIAILGAGPAGLAAAQAASLQHARVTLISTELPGGRAGWHSLLPSKVLLTAADCISSSESWGALGITGLTPLQLDLSALRSRVADLSTAWSQEQQQRLRAQGVQFIQGKAKFLAPQQLQIEDPQGSRIAFSADTFILATGSVPVFPPRLKPDGDRILAPRFTGNLQSLPESMIVIGGGVTGTETAFAFCSLGVEVTWVVNASGVLPSFSDHLATALEKALTGRGIRLVQGAAAQSATPLAQGVQVDLEDGRSLSAHSAFIAIGRRPDIAGLNLPAISLPQDPRIGIAVDRQCRSLVGRIYAAGDVTGAPMTANKAMAQGWSAGLHASGIARARYDPNRQIEAVFTNPQAAQVGLQPSAAREAGFVVEQIRVDLQGSLKSRLLSESRGFLTLILDAQRRTILGANAVCPHAADMLAPVAVALKLAARISDLEEIFLAHPTLSELVPLAARSSRLIEQDSKHPKEVHG